MSGSKPLVVNGWTLFAHPIFLDQLDALTAQVEALERKDPAGYVKKNATKRLAAIAKLAFEAIPQDPARPEQRTRRLQVGLDAAVAVIAVDEDEVRLDAPARELLEAAPGRHPQRADLACRECHGFPPCRRTGSC